MKATVTYTIDNTGFYADEILADGSILTVDREIPAVKLDKPNNGIRYTAQISSADDSRNGKKAWAVATGTKVADVKATVKEMWAAGEEANYCPF